MPSITPVSIVTLPRLSEWTASGSVQALTMNDSTNVAVARVRSFSMEQRPTAWTANCLDDHELLLREPHNGETSILLLDPANERERPRLGSGLTPCC
jgi:hypothetical protein